MPHPRECSIAHASCGDSGDTDPEDPEHSEAEEDSCDYSSDETGSDDLGCHSSSSRIRSRSRTQDQSVSTMFRSFVRSATGMGAERSAAVSDTNSDFDYEALVYDKARRVSLIELQAEKLSPPVRRFRQHLFLAISVGFFVTLASLPMFFPDLHYIFFGQRGDLVNQGWRRKGVHASSNSSAAGASEGSDDQITCRRMDIGRLRNTAPPGDYPRLKDWTYGMAAWDEHSASDIWCGWLPESWATYWPNMAQFIVFSVYANTGTTIQFSCQGLLGTVLAVLNVHILQFIFPSGAHGYVCQSVGGSTDEPAKPYLVIAFSAGFGGWVHVWAATMSEAIHKYQFMDRGGLLGRAIFDPQGKVDPNYHWFQSGWKEKFEQRFETIRDSGCTPGQIVYDDPNYQKWGEIVCMMDVFLVVFLFLLSNSASNTLTWALSWHVWFMMDFMNPANGIPQINSEKTLAGQGSLWTRTMYFVVEATCWVGVVISIVSTLIPCINLQNLSQLFKDAMYVTGSIASVWSESTSYMVSGEVSGQRYQIETRIDSLAGAAGNASANLDGAWWETVFIRRRARCRREWLALYHANASNVKDMVFIVKSSVLSEEFTPTQCAFFKQLRSPMANLVQETTALMWLCLQACQDGVIDPWEIKQIEVQIETVNERQEEFNSALTIADLKMSSDLSEAHTFIFALSYWCRRTKEMACLIKGEETISTFRRGSSLFGTIVRSLKLTWDPSVIFRCRHLIFTFRNLLSISVCFLIGYYVESGIFVQYSATMPMTLSLLLINDGSHHVEYEKCMHRLLGVVLGKCSPIIIAAFYGFVDCGSWERSVLQGFSIWLFVSVFCFAYYDSKTWSYIGCLVAGFGIYGLVVPCAGTATESVMVSKYKEIGMVIVAIFIQGVLHSLLGGAGPRKKLLYKMDGLWKSISDGFTSVFAGDVHKIGEAGSKANKLLRQVKELAAECDPKVQVFQGWIVEFDMDLANRLIASFENVVGELRMLEIAASDWIELAPPINDSDQDQVQSKARVLTILANECRADMTNIMHEIMGHITTITRVVPVILGVTTEDVRELCEVDNKSEINVKLTKASVLYSRLANAVNSGLDCAGGGEELTDDVALKLTIAVRSLERTMYHLGKIERLCAKEYIRQAL